MAEIKLGVAVTVPKAGYGSGLSFSDFTSTPLGECEIITNKKGREYIALKGNYIELNELSMASTASNPFFINKEGKLIAAGKKGFLNPLAQCSRTEGKIV